MKNKIKISLLKQKQLMFSNLQSLNPAQTALAKRLIERMSSLIIDKESFETLIELIEYKVKQKLTPKQRKLMSRKKKPARKGRKPTASDGDDNDDDDDNGSDSADGDDASSVSDSEAGDRDETHDDQANDGDEQHILKHIDDDGEKGMKLLSLILSMHVNYAFANSGNFKRLVSCIGSPKEHIVSATLNILATHFSWDTVRVSSDGGGGGGEQAEHRKTLDSYLTKLKTLCKAGRPKQAKHAVYVLHNCFEKPRNEQILIELYKLLVAELELKREKNFVTCLISLGHVCLLVPKPIGKDVKEFLLRSVVKDILMQPSNVAFSLENSSADNSAGTVTVSRRRNNLKLAGKWCENEDELPFSTRARVNNKFSFSVLFLLN